jgi:hypothetical protein
MDYREGENMNLPSIIDVGTIMAMGGLILMITQYVKGAVPEKLIPVASILIGIGVAFLYYWNPQTYDVDWVKVVANGILAAIAADTGYNFMSGSQSPPLSLSSKTNGTKPSEVAKVADSKSPLTATK